MLAPACMVTVSACRISVSDRRNDGTCPPCQSPPTNTTPPPSAPAALIVLEACNTISSASRKISPPLLVRLLASTTPEWLMTLETKLLAALADRCTAPPCAEIAPPLAIRASSAPCSTSSMTGPPVSSVTLAPAPMSTWPAGAETTPLLSICDAIRTT